MGKQCKYHAKFTSGETRNTMIFEKGRLITVRSWTLYLKWTEERYKEKNNTCTLLAWMFLIKFNVCVGKKEMVNFKFSQQIRNQ